MFEKIVLASASPRRRELLKAAGFEHEVIVANIEEKRRHGERPEDYVQRNAKEKALAVCNTQPVAVAKAIVLAADTIVVAYDNEVLEKPSDTAEARRMLGKLSGRTHRVMTGFALCNGTTGEVLHCTLVQTQVLFRDLFTDEIERYIASGEPFDKAGSYGIQGHALTFVESIEGSYTNVVGLPMSHVVLSLRRLMPSIED
ncbi:MAG: septum formation inhibitor Maf [Betaproteobacteria bacterium]|nr:septum formation inhibitor Maf [Betaproteobacteria bacterium]